MSISYEQTQNMMVIEVFKPRTDFSKKEKKKKVKRKNKIWIKNTHYWEKPL